MVFEGYELDELKQVPHRPGSWELRLYTLNPLSQDKLDSLYSNLINRGVRVKEAPYSTLETPSKTVIRFSVPKDGYGFLPVAVLLTLAIGAVGIASILGWRVGEVVGEIGKKLVPVALIGAGALVLYGLVTKK